MKRGPIDLVGHFGTTFSYATVASSIAERLMLAGMLGRVTNLDADWHKAHEVLRMHAMAFRDAEQGSHVLVVSVPHHYLDAFPQMYGRGNSAIFMSPNTDALSEEHAGTCAKFGLALAPSEWCAATTRAALFDMSVDADGIVDTAVSVVSLGVADELLDRRKQRIERLRSRLSLPQNWISVLHMSTDQSWPGRKGTEELLFAWNALYGGKGRKTKGQLVLHIPPALRPEVLRRVRELEIEESCKIVIGELHGGDEDLVSLLDEADLVVAPSRCEGFGIMFASALVAGVPLVCTYATGQRDFLFKLPGWMALPTDERAELAGEVGLAPTISPHLLAAGLRLAMQEDVRRELLVLLSRDVDWEAYTWRSASRRFAERLTEWIARED